MSYGECGSYCGLEEENDGFYSLRVFYSSWRDYSASSKVNIPNEVLDAFCGSREPLVLAACCPKGFI